MSEPYYEDYDDAEGYEGEPAEDVVQDYIDQAVDERVGPYVQYVDELAAQQQRWDAEDAAREAEEQAQAQEAEANQMALEYASDLVEKHAQELGVETLEAKLDAWEIANRLVEDRDFMPGRDETERVHGALREAVWSVAPAKDELDACDRYMVRTRQPKGPQFTNQEARELREALGMPPDQSLQRERERLREMNERHFKLDRTTSTGRDRHGRLAPTAEHPAPED